MKQSETIITNREDFFNVSNEGERKGVICFSICMIIPVNVYAMATLITQLTMDIVTSVQQCHG